MGWRKDRLIRLAHGVALDPETFDELRERWDRRYDEAAAVGGPAPAERAGVDAP